MHGFLGVAVAHFWEDAKTTKLAIENLSAETTSRRGVSQPREDCKVVEINLWWHPDVTGTLSSRFSELPDLQLLHLGRTTVSGDIEALQNLTELTELKLYSTKVSGNIEALKNLKKLKRLDLDSTNVIGDITALENLTELTKLSLAYTNVIGDMSALENLTSLGNGFDIEGTKITCDEAALLAVLRSLGLQAEQLTDLKNSRGVKRMLSCRNMTVFLMCFLAHHWWIKLDHAWPE